ncbi:MAG: M20/M25/M40 family metallo-hydrolase [Chloroflexota bacterium]|nr:M20/M25/M40 family metallo-hydrolase [Chloroflexota bacterium]
MSDLATGEATELLQQLIRNGCVNDGTPESGHEDRQVAVLCSYLDVPGAELETFSKRPGRANLVLRIEGRDRAAPTLVLMGHTDVVPANAEGWRRDPFGGELVDGEVWGRGAVDMLNLTATMAVATKQLLRGGFRPRGTLVYLAVADEENEGIHGARFMTDEHWDRVRADYVISENGGVRSDLPSTSDGLKLHLTVAEKGTQWVKLRVRGTPGHGSAPYRSDNAVTKAARIVARVAAYEPPIALHDIWRRYVTAMAFPAELERAFTDPERLDASLASMPAGLAKLVHASTRNTLSPNVLRGGTKVNVIADEAIVEIDIRTLPDASRDAVRSLLQDAVGDLWTGVELLHESDNVSTASPSQTPLTDVLDRVTRSLLPEARLVPAMTVGATDNRFFRRKGAVAYGYGLMSPTLTMSQFRSMFHGRDERVHVESLRLSAELWERTAREFLG